MSKKMDVKCHLQNIQKPSEQPWRESYDNDKGSNLNDLGPGFSFTRPRWIFAYGESIVRTLRLPTYRFIT